MPTVFYSWQSDAPNNTNRSFIEQALQKAVKDLNSELEEAERGDEDVVLTQDTQGVPGTPDIAQAIFDKIEHCDVFVCDISLVLDAVVNPERRRRSPNPNVLIELGYALHVLGGSRVLMVLNTALGSVENLPFDLRGRRPVSYQAADGDTDIPEKRAQLAKSLSRRIDEILKMGTRGERQPYDIAADGIASQAPNRRVLVRQAVDALVKRLGDLAPSNAAAQLNDDEFLQLLRSSFAVHRDFHKLISNVVEYQDSQSLQGVVLGLQGLAENYWVPRGYSGMIPANKCEFFWFSGRCWLLLAAADMMRHASWNLLIELFGTHIVVRNPREEKPGDRLLTYLNQPSLMLHAISSNTRRVSIFADLIKEMVEDTAWSADLTIEEIIEADLLLSLWTSAKEGLWLPEVIVYMEMISSNVFLNSLQRRSRAEQVAKIIGLEGVDALRIMMKRIKEALSNWLSGHQPLLRYDASTIGTLTE